MTEDMTLTFHTVSFSTAHLVWHCPYVCVFSASDGKVNGANYREHLLLRLDGENWGDDAHTENSVTVEKTADFGTWDAWKEKNKEGYDCTVTIHREKDRVVMETENQGISLHSETVIRNGAKDLYVALTGDQCVITNIRVKR